MPITIGSQTDVPSTGDPIVSPWYQDTSRKIVHTFATNAARDGWTSRPEGAVAYTLDTNTLWMYNGGAWVELIDNGGGFVGLNPSSAAGIELRPDGQYLASINNVVNGPNFTLGRGGGPVTANGQPFINFYRGASVGAPLTTQTGSITIASATAIAYNTTSDPRAKTSAVVRGIDDAAARAAALGRTAWRGQYVDPETGEPEAETWDFLSSHDIEDLAGYAVTGERDAVDDAGQPVYQQVNYPALVPLLFAALADALDRIAALEAGA